MNPVNKAFSVIGYLFSIPREDSYFPEKERKSYIRRVCDMMKWYLKYRSLNTFYNLYGMDIKGTDSNNFIDDKSFFNSLYKKNKKGSPDSQIVILRNKLLFRIYVGIKTPEILSVVVNQKLFDLSFNEISINSLDYSDCFIKDIGGQCASYVKKIKNNADLQNKLYNECSDSIYLIQRNVIQHKDLSALYCDAVNTIRIVTLKERIDSEPYVFTALLRVGTHISQNVDNWAAGGLAVGIDESGKLKEYGFYKPMYGTKVLRHPDSNIIFKGYQIPYYEEAKKVAIKAHKGLYNIFAIGWDVAITPEGPCIIEGNDNWEISLQQACDRPLKNEWVNILINN